MKKVTIFIILICILAGCGTSSPSPEIEQNNTSGPSPTHTEESQPSAEQPMSKAASGTILGEFMTPLYDKQEGRLHNIALAISKLDGVTLRPGEEFSFNAIVGPRTKENGYQEAIIFEQKRKTKGYGGGVCQVSTTIFNTAKNAGMTITEQHEHELEVPYAKKGMDAAVAYGELDFRFVNSSDISVRLGISMTQSYVIAQLTAI